MTRCRKFGSSAVSNRQALVHMKEGTKRMVEIDIHDIASSSWSIEKEQDQTNDD